MVVQDRQTGIEFLGQLPWGSHLCVFYGTPNDLTDILVPFFKAGLENNELCIWVTSPSLGNKEAIAAMAKEIPDLNRYMENGQMEFIPHYRAYLQDGVFSEKKITDAVAVKNELALQKGYDGMRSIGDVSWLKNNDWNNFARYEANLNTLIREFKMLALCAYPLDKCKASDFIDIMSTHNYVIDKHNSSFILLGNPEYQQARQVYDQSEEQYYSVIQNLREELQEARESFYKTARASPDIIAITTLNDGKFIDVNDNFFRVFGYTRNEVIGRSSTELNLWTDTKRRKRMLKKLKLQSRIQNEEAIHRTKSGEIRTLKCSAELHTIDGQPCIITVMTDITGRIMEEEKEQAIISLAIDGFWITDLNGRFLEVNDSYCRMIGYTREELLKMSISDIEALERPEDTAGRVKKIMLFGSDRFKTQHRCKYGKIIDIEINTSYYNVGEGQLFVFIHDLTGRKEAEDSRDTRLETRWRKNITKLQEKFIKEGFQNFEDREIIELLLSLVMPARKAKQLAIICIDRFKKLGNFLKASPEELTQIGVTPACVFCIAMLHKLPIKVLQEKISEQSIYDSPQEIFDYFYYSMRDLKKEVFKVIFLNPRNQIMEVVDLFEGTTDKIVINAREVIESAIAHNTKSLIFVHNHPSGDPTPSQADKQLTRDLVFVGNILQIRVLDHIIIGENRYFSFASEELIKEYEMDFLNLKLTGTSEAKQRLSKVRLSGGTQVINLILGLLFAAGFASSFSSNLFI
jgi:DNA repair protein RadC